MRSVSADDGEGSLCDFVIDGVEEKEKVQFHFAEVDLTGAECHPHHHRRVLSCGILESDGGGGSANRGGGVRGGGGRGTGSGQRRPFLCKRGPRRLEPAIVGQRVQEERVGPTTATANSTGTLRGGGGRRGEEEGRGGGGGRKKKFTEEGDTGGSVGSTEAVAL